MLLLRDAVFSRRLEEHDQYDSLMLEPLEALTDRQAKEIERLIKDNRKYEAPAPVYQ